MPHEKNRSPCTTLLTGVLLTAPAVLHESASRIGVPERNAEPPAGVLTPERAAQRGITEGQVSEGLILHEEAPFVGGIQLKEAKVSGGTVTTVKMDVAYCDIINRNGRYYPRSAYEAANANADLDGGLWSLLDHPEWWEPLKGSLEKVCVRIDKIGIEDREVEWPVGSGEKRTLGVVYAEGVLIETAKGLDAKALLKGRVKVGISTNGWGSTQWVRAAELDPSYYDPEELIPVTQDDYRYLSIDLVSDPSNLGGRARTESRRPPVHPPAQPPVPQEGNMHKLLKALLEKYPGKTLDQVKAEHASEYLAVLEKIAQESAEAPTEPPAAPPVTPAPQPGTQAEASLEGRVLALTTALETERLERVAATRRSIVAHALEQANLPRIGVIEGIDFDARFRERVEAAAMNAQDDAAATEAVNALIVERRAYAGNQPAPAARPQFEHLNRAANPGPQVPSGDTSASVQQEGYAPVREAFSELF